MRKLNVLPRVVLLSLVALFGATSTAAYAGSIVINLPPQPQPKKLSYVSEGRHIDLEWSWSDVEISAGLKRWLDERFGENRGDYPYMIDKQSGTVTVLVDRAAGQYEVVSIQRLLD